MKTLGVGQIWLRRTTQFMHQGPAPVREQHHFRATGFAQAPGVLAGLVNIKIVMCVLDQRHAQTASDKKRNQGLKQSGFAGTRVAGDAKNLHAINAEAATDTDISSAELGKVSTDANPPPGVRKLVV